MADDDEAPKIATTTGKKSTPSSRRDNGGLKHSQPTEESGKFSDTDRRAPKPGPKKK